MTEREALLRETQDLADLMFDQRIEPHAMRRLEELLSSDMGCLQAYVERLNFHGDLMRRSSESNSLSQVSSAMSKALLSRERRERRSRMLINAVCSACVAVLVGVGGWFAFPQLFLPGEVGTVASLTSETQFESGELALGQIMRKGETISVSSGIASLQLLNVQLDVIAPASICLTDAKTLELKSGTIYGYVSRGGEGFSVRTPDSLVVDLGTEFVVDYQQGKGTKVDVRSGKVQANLLSLSGVPIQQLLITAERSALFSARNKSAAEIDYAPEKFERIDRSRGQLVNIDGQLRTTTTPVASLGAGETQTRNHLLILPENQHVVLPDDLTTDGLLGVVQLPAGTRVSSYLVHYDPDNLTTLAPRGSATFRGQIVNILAATPQLTGTDAIFGRPDVTYDPSAARGLELDEDEVRVSGDQKTVSFYFGVSGDRPVDQARILVVEAVP